MLLSLPIFDVFAVMSNRFFSFNNVTLINRFKNMFQSDRNHIHHIILNRFKSEKNTVYIIYLFTLLISIISILFWVNNDVFNLNYGLIFVFLLILILRLILYPK